MAKKETCTKCGSTIFAVAKDKSNKHYCQAKGCGNVWVPGLEGLKRSDVVLRQAQLENIELKTEIARLRKENQDLRAEANAKVAGKSEDEIFT